MNDYRVPRPAEAEALEGFARSTQWDLTILQEQLRLLRSVRLESWNSAAGHAARNGMQEICTRYAALLGTMESLIQAAHRASWEAAQGLDLNESLVCDADEGFPLPLRRPQ